MSSVRPVTFGHPAEGRVRGAGQQPGQVAGAVADHRHRLLGEAGEDQLALLAVREHLLGDRVDDLGIEVVLPDVQPVLRRAGLLRDARADHLAEPVDVDGRDPGALLEVSAHLVGPRLGAEHPDLQGRRARVHALAVHLVEDRQEVRRRHQDDPWLEVEDQLHLPLGHPAADRYDGAAEALGTVVRAEPAGEQAVAVGHVHHVAGACAGGVQRPRDHVGPHRRGRRRCSPRRSASPSYRWTRAPAPPRRAAPRTSRTGSSAAGPPWLVNGNRARSASEVTSSGCTPASSNARR